MTKFEEARDCAWNYVEKSTNTELCIRTEGDVLKISFQGSRSLMDWIQNFMFKQVPYKGMSEPFLVHRGFIKKYKSVRKYLLSTVQNYLDNGIKRIEVYGFSQGAALGFLATEDLIFHFGNIVNSYLFGSPKVFGELSKKISGYLYNNVKLYNVKNDIVTKVPLKIQGYKLYGDIKVFPKRYMAFIWNWRKIHIDYKSYNTVG